MQRNQTWKIIVPDKLESGKTFETFVYSVIIVSRGDDNCDNLPNFFRKRMEIHRFHLWSHHRRFQAISHHVQQVLHPKPDPVAHPSNDCHCLQRQIQSSQSRLSKVSVKSSFYVQIFERQMCGLVKCDEMSQIWQKHFIIFLISFAITEIPMNRIEVGNAPSPNLKKVQSKIGSLQNATHKPGEIAFI